MSYSLPYILLLTFYGFLAYLYEQIDNEFRKKQISIVAVLVFFIFFAFRGYLYTDWVSYVQYFENIEWNHAIINDIDGEDFKEPGFALLTVLCKTFVNNYFFLVFVCTSIDTYLFLRFLKRRDINNIALVFMLFITFEGLSIMFNLLRNALSLFIFMNAIEYIEKRKPIAYFSLCIIALSIHLSSIMYFPLYFFLHKKLNKWIFLGVFTGCLFFYISNSSLIFTLASLSGLEGPLGDKLNIYTELFSTSRVLSLTGTIEKVGLTTLVFLYYDEIIDQLKGRIVIINSLLCYLIMYYMLAEFNTFSYRMSILFIFSYWILWGDIIKVLYVKNNKRIVSALIYIYCIYVTIFAVSTPIQQYDNILFGAKSYQERLNIFNRTYQADE